MEMDIDKYIGIFIFLIIVAAATGFYAKWKDARDGTDENTKTWRILSIVVMVFLPFLFIADLLTPKLLGDGFDSDSTLYDVVFWIITIGLFFLFFYLKNLLFPQEEKEGIVNEKKGKKKKDKKKKKKKGKNEKKKNNIEDEDVKDEEQ